jgi:ABC-type nitrate/sulfonate/bicarbonate transport system substrate-binding protein
MGYHKEEGVTLERLYTRSGPQGIATLVSGAGDAYFTAPGELLVAVGRGQKLKVVMGQAMYHALFFLISKDYAAKHGVTEDMSFEQRLAIGKGFKGIRCGVTSPGSVTDHCARRVMIQLGIDSAKDAQIVPVQSVENTIAAMANGTIDAMVIPSPTAEKAQFQLGAIVHFSVSKNEISGFGDVTGHVMEARTADVEQRPDLFRSMIRAETRALRYIVENPNVAGELLYKAQFATTIAPDEWRTIWDRNVRQFKSPYVTRTSLEAWITMGMVPGVTDPKAIDLGSVLDMRFVDQAVKDLGWAVPS